MRIKNRKIITGKIPGLIKLYYDKFKNTIFILLPEKKRLIIHKDGTCYLNNTQNFSIKKGKI